ncbi:uncharacterized protein LTR77_009485 [Saxophila tyrrhenica]|uniref:Beta-galactosidase n=1 Tax=Saxophila tyrrhenica TaxID=1690608 RepID=A0AAV9NXY9_9PEZI|nr:hypothetical protein LTR77_009485 [Saxophila tyrrhenica]
MPLNDLPHIARTATAGQLIVNGRPFLVRGAELQNSSFSSVQHMAGLWQKMVDMSVNTVLGSVSWEMVEPREGHFDFSVIDQVIRDARSYNLKLILLWFGTWKNGISTYVPRWVKMSPKRFPRVVVQTRDGRAEVTETISCVHGATVDADAAAFRSFVRHLNEVDGEQNTVVMVQVQNEVGVLGDSRDRSDAANEVYQSNVPSDLVRFLREDWHTLHPDLKSKLEDRHTLVEGYNWPQTFGQSIYTDEMFMAYHYARYVEKVAQAGQSEHSLPMFANFWLNYGEDSMAKAYPTLAGGGDLPGDYPAGGAVSSVLDIWMKFAPSLSFISPDTYLNDYHRVCSTYRHRKQPLFIPEQRRDEYGARRIWAAVGEYRAIGSCPFALDTLEVDDCAYTKHYALMASVEDLVMAAQRETNSIAGFFFDEPDHKEASSHPDPVFEMAGYELTVERAFTTGAQGAGYGLIIHRETNSDGTAKFLLVGAGFQVKFRSLATGTCFTGILDFEEKTRDQETGEFATHRRLNGDETRSGHQAIMPNEDPDDGGFPINICIPAVTKMAECIVYGLSAEG